MGHGLVSAFTIVNCVGIIFSVINIFDAADSVYFGHTKCDDPFPKQGIVFGVWILILSIMGIICSHWENKYLRVVYTIFLCVLTLASLWLTGVLSFGASNGEAGQEYSKKTYEMSSYAPWLREYLVGEEMMADFKKCMVEQQVCQNNLYPEDSLAHPIEIGCCRPPTDCGYKKKNATVWKMPKDGAVKSDNLDCLEWDIEGDGFCFKCEACKAGYLAVVLRHWCDRDLFCFVFSIVLLSCYYIVIHVKDSDKVSRV